MHTAELAADRVTALPLSPPTRLATLSDADLLATTQRLAGTSNQVFAALLEHLAEVDARGLHRTRACSSLYTYCIYELRFSEELAKLVRRLSPFPAVPDRFEPLGPVPVGISRDATWAKFVESLCPPVRDLPAGARPGEWVDERANTPISEAVDKQGLTTETTETTAPARCEDPPSLYEVHFTTTAEHAELLERARALLSHRSPKLSLGDLHLQAMRLLVQMLEKHRYGTARDVNADAAPVQDSALGHEHGPERSSEPVGNAETEAVFAHAFPPRRRGRYIQASVRRAVFERDERRCTYTDERGVRCRETHRIEIHHGEPFALGGPHRLENLALRCQAHNALAAEQDFGREHLEQQRDGCRHESQSCVLQSINPRADPRDAS